MEEVMNLTVCNLAQKLVCVEDNEGGKFDVFYAWAESATDDAKNDLYNRWGRSK